MKPICRNRSGFPLWVLVVSFFGYGAKGDSPASIRLPSGKTITARIEEMPDQRARLTLNDGRRSETLLVGQPAPSITSFPWTVRFVSLPSMSTPLVLALSSEVGGSDCGYYVTPIAIVDGDVTHYFPSDDVHFSNEGGLAIWISGHRTRMVNWSPIWAGREGHYDAHRYEYFWYSWNDSLHKFQYNRSTKSSKRLEAPGESLGLVTSSSIELSARTRAEWFPEAADGC